MVTRIKEIVIRWEDDGEESPLSKEELREKYAPLRMDVHHHCAPPKVNISDSEAMKPEKPKRTEVDLTEIDPIADTKVDA